MTNFMTLPKAVREKIYRLHLIADEQPVDFEAYKTHCGYQSVSKDDNRFARLSKGETRKMPPLLRVSRKIEREASPIFYGENTFALSKPEAFQIWKRFMFPRHLRHISKVVLLGWCTSTPAIANDAFALLWNFLKSKTLTIMIDEEAELRKLLERDPVFRCGGRSGIGPQIGLQLLRLEGMTAFKVVEGVGELKFIKPGSAFDSKSVHDVGSIHGGVLEAIRGDMVRRSLKASPKYNGFRFLDLPPEIRNVIYSMLLVFPGATYPIAGKPVSVTSRFKYMGEQERENVRVPRSALELLRVNRQIHAEAVGLFYQNDFVFATPAKLQLFLASLGNRRLDCIRSLTLFNEYGQLFDQVKRDGRYVYHGPPHIEHKPINQRSPEGLDKMEIALLLVRRLRGLRKFHLLLRNSTLDDPDGRRSSSPDPSKRRLCYDKLRSMFELRQIPDIKVRDLDVEFFDEWLERKFEKDLSDELPLTVAEHRRRERGMVLVEREKATLKHLNHGLRLAQEGLIVHELVAFNAWREKEIWPDLQGSHCGLSKGCSCGPTDDREAENVQTSV